MNLFDPSRPRISHKPAFSSGMTIIPQLYLRPIESDSLLVEISAMLPVGGEGPFVSKQFQVQIKLDKLSELITQFRADPEETLSNLFGSDPSGFVPALATEPDAKSWAREQRKQREREDPDFVSSTLTVKTFSLLRRD